EVRYATGRQARHSFDISGRCTKPTHHAQISGLYRSIRRQNGETEFLDAGAPFRRLSSCFRKNRAILPPSQARICSSEGGFLVISELGIYIALHSVALRSTCLAVPGVNWRKACWP